MRLIYKFLVVLFVLIGCGSATNEVAYRGIVVDRSSGVPIPNARVSLQLAANPSQSIRTDAEGQYSFVLALEQNTNGKIIVEADGYQRYEANIVVQPNQLQLQEIQLILEQNQSSVPTPISTKESSTASPSKTPASPPVGIAPSKIPASPPVGITPSEIPASSPVGITPSEIPTSSPVGTPSEIPTSSPVGTHYELIPIPTEESLIYKMIVENAYGLPIADAQVILSIPGFEDMYGITNDIGIYQFKLKSNVATRASVSIFKENFRTLETTIQLSSGGEIILVLSYAARQQLPPAETPTPTQLLTPTQTPTPLQNADGENLPDGNVPANTVEATP